MLSDEEREDLGLIVDKPVLDPHTKLMCRIVQIDNERKALEAQIERLGKERAEHEKIVLGWMQTNQVASTKINNRTISIRRDRRPKCMDIETLKQHEDFGYLVKETVNHKSLQSAVLNGMLDDDGNVAIPDELKNVIEVAEIFSVRTTRS